MYPPCSHFLMKPKSIKWIGMIGSDLQWRVYIKIRFRGWGIKPMPPALKGRALTTGPQRKSLKFHFYCLTGAVGWSSFWVSHRVKNVSSQSCLTKLQPLSWKGLREFSRAFCLQRGRGDTSPHQPEGSQSRAQCHGREYSKRKQGRLWRQPLCDLHLTDDNTGLEKALVMVK